MKKLMIIAALCCLAACNRTPDQAGGGSSDASKAVGGSLAVDSLKSIVSRTNSPKTKSLDSLDTVGKI